MRDPWVIVAIPSRDDPIWKVSSEKIPHLTILYLQPQADTSEDQVFAFVEHAAETMLHRFGLSVEKRGLLGPEDADVLFFEKAYAENVTSFRETLLRNAQISLAYHAAEQYPSWTPHLTLGYPETPVLSDPEYPVSWVNFDRIALWSGDFEGREVELSGYSETAVAYSATEVSDFLAHYGVKGMKWGVRKERTPAERRAKIQKKLDKLDMDKYIEGVSYRGYYAQKEYKKKRRKDPTYGDRRLSPEEVRAVQKRNDRRAATRITIMGMVECAGIIAGGKMAPRVVDLPTRQAQSLQQGAYAFAAMNAIHRTRQLRAVKTAMTFEELQAELKKL